MNKLLVIDIIYIIYLPCDIVDNIIIELIFVKDPFVLFIRIIKTTNLLKGKRYLKRYRHGKMSSLNISKLCLLKFYYVTLKTSCLWLLFSLGRYLENIYILFNLKYSGETLFGHISNVSVLFKLSLLAVSISSRCHTFSKVTV